MTFTLIIKFVFFFFGTFLHELAHYSSALILGKAEGFSVLPKLEGRMFVFGSVKSRTKYKVLSSVIAAAPVIWWVLLLLLLIHSGAVRFNGYTPSISTALIVARIKSFSLGDLFPVWLALQLLWAGRLSATDIKNFLAGFFSISGVIVLAAAAALVYLLVGYK